MAAANATCVGKKLMARESGLIGHGVNIMLTPKSILYSLPSKHFVYTLDDMAHPQTHPEEGVEERFEFILALLGSSRAEFSKQPGCAQQNIYGWLKRRKFSSAAVKVLRDLSMRKGIIGFTEDWLNYGIGEEPRLPTQAGDGIPMGGTLAYSDQRQASPGYARFPYLAGYSKELSQFVDLPVVLLAKLGERITPSVRVFINPGDTLKGVIDRGDLVFVDTSVRRVDGDGIYVYKIAGIAQIRRFQIRPQGVLRLTGTHAYEDSLELSGLEIEGLEIGGRVVGKLGPTDL